MGRVKETAKNATVKCVKAMCGMTGWTIGFTAQGMRTAKGFTKKAIGSAMRTKERFKRVTRPTAEPQKKRVPFVKRFTPNLIVEQLNRIVPRKKPDGKKTTENKDESSLYENTLFKQARRDISDEQPSKRYNAIMTLANIGAKMGVESVAKPLMGALKDANGNIRSQACKVLVDMKARSAIDAIALLLNDNNPRSRLEALRGINKLSGSSSSILEHLINAAKDSHREMRKRAATYLGWTESEVAVNPLLNLINDEESIVRKAAILALGELRSSKAIMPIIDMLNNKNGEVREMAVYTLRELTGQNFGYNPKAKDEERNKAVDEWVYWWNSNSSSFKIQKRTFVVSGETTLEYWERIKKEESDKRDDDEQAKQEARMKAKKGAERKAKKDAEDKAKQEAEDKAKQESENKAKQEAAKKAKQDAEDKAKQEAEDKAKQESENKAKQEAAKKAKKVKQDAEDKAKQDAEDKARQESEKKAKQEAGKKAKKVKQDAEDKAKQKTEGQDLKPAQPAAQKNKSKTIDKKKLQEQMGPKLKLMQAKLDKSKKSRERQHTQVENLKDKMENLERLLKTKEKNKNK